MSGPQRERHLQLVVHLAAQQRANVDFPLLRQRTTSIPLAPTGFVAQSRRTIERVPLADVERPIRDRSVWSAISSQVQSRCTG
ncbi:hypothetical protein ISG08_28890 [Burkholderia pseudomallei]|uniref:hypothetical protein n=1 Tax=Burkholderia pseudomallei TaxID=28450 RepID=UPI000A465C04|nr:hypothetical protein [Burkholderia pseudomallei]MBF3807037.1 hypothetical protein [Burkholderia pseudomallei]MDS1027066.1 hypothetical protein [Burkholderia pseudomallei]